MRTFLSGVLVLLSLTIAGKAQDDNLRPSLMTSIPNTAKYEIVQTNFQISTMTFRLDKTTGRVSQLAMCPQRTFIGNGLCWKEMTVLELPKPGGDLSARYQIFVQGGNTKSVLLMNTATGQTWQHGVDGADKWSPLLEPLVLQQSYEIVK